MLREIRWYLETAAFLAISFIVARLPDQMALSAGKWLGRACFHLLGMRRRVALENIEASLPFLERQPGWVRRSPRALALETFENLGRSVVEDCKIYHGRGRHLLDAVEFRGLEHVRQAQTKGTGVAFITAHCGNWDLLALAFGARVQGLSVVARRQDNRHLNAILEGIRRAYGNEVIYKSSALRNMLAAFRRKEMVGMLIDQAVGQDEGILLDFIGRPAWTTKLPAYIARKSGTPMVPAFIHREGELQVVTFHPEVIPSGLKDLESAAAEDVATLTGFVERYVIEHPTEWYWIHKRWKGTPPNAAGAPSTSGADGAR